MVAQRFGKIIWPSISLISCIVLSTKSAGFNISALAVSRSFMMCVNLQSFLMCDLDYYFARALESKIWFKGKKTQLNPKPSLKLAGRPRPIKMVPTGQLIKDWPQIG